jgi:hypothetical protein
VAFGFINPIPKNDLSLVNLIRSASLVLKIKGTQSVVPTKFRDVVPVFPVKFQYCAFTQKKHVPRIKIKNSFFIMFKD